MSDFLQRFLLSLSAYPHKRSGSPLWFGHPSQAALLVQNVKAISGLLGIGTRKNEFKGLNSHSLVPAFVPVSSSRYTTSSSNRSAVIPTPKSFLQSSIVHFNL